MGQETKPCPHWTGYTGDPFKDFTCDLGTDCKCVEGQNENIDNSDITGWPVKKEE